MLTAIWQRGGFLLALLAGATLARAEGDVVRLASRPNVTLTSHYLSRPDATATVVLLTGGGGNIGLTDGEPRSANFLIRSRQRFFEQGFNVFALGRPSDHTELDGVFRTSAEHLEDLRSVVWFLKESAGKPVWLVGTSAGTLSAAHGAIGLEDAIAGVVLTSSITSFQVTGAPARQALERVRVPVLVMHHRQDACRHSLANGTSWIMRGLSAAPVKKLVMVDGGHDPTGPVCEPLHWHGFINMEDEAVAAIAEWIRHPTSAPVAGNNP